MRLFRCVHQRHTPPHEHMPTFCACSFQFLFLVQFSLNSHEDAGLRGPFLFRLLMPCSVVVGCIMHIYRHFFSLCLLNDPCAFSFFGVVTVM